MSKSEIFDKYAEIALKEGLISVGKEEKPAKETKELKEYKNSVYPRMDSCDISAIEALYGVKPDGQDYEYNIVEKAHPKPAIVSPAHDKINGLVENVNERNNIMVNITKKPVDGHSTYHKYAKQELLKAIVRTANDLDNKNQEQLRALADHCLTELSKQEIKKEALLPAIGFLGWLSVGALASILGYTAISNNILPSDQGVMVNCEHSIEELNDLLDGHMLHFLDENLPSGSKEKILELRGKLYQLKTAAEAYNNLDPSFEINNVSDINKVKDRSIKTELDKTKITVDRYEETLQEANKLIGPATVALMWAKDHPSEGSSNWAARLKDVWHLISPTDINDALRYLKTLKVSISKALSEISSVKNNAGVQAESILSKYSGKKKTKKVKNQPINE